MMLRHILASIILALLSQTHAMDEQQNVQQRYGVAGENDGSGFICPDSNPINCYPKLFEPSNEWKEVKEGQMIPAGLEVRLDLENMKREARLDTAGHDDATPKQRNHDIVVANMNPNFQSSLDFMHGFSDRMYSKTSFVIVVDHLETLVEWSSDRESGIAIANDIKPLLKLSGIYASSHDHGRGGVKGGRVDKGIHVDLGLSAAQSLQVQDMVLRILASSFRNNVEAQEVLLNHLPEPEDFLKRLVVGDEEDAPLIMKRKLGLLGALINNGIFHQYLEKGGIESKLVLLYGKIDDESVQERILNLLDDSKLVKRGDDDGDDVKGQEDLETRAKRYAHIAQKLLVESDADAKASVGEKTTEEQILENLADLKKQNSFKPQNEFLDWLDRRINSEKREVLRKRDLDENSASSSADPYMDLERLVHLRHEVFGNPLGSRRDFVDEL